MPTTSTESFQGNPTTVTSRWEEPDGRQPPVLYCRTTTDGRDDLCEQRSRVLLDSETREPWRLVVETRLLTSPGAAEVVYVRIYERLDRQCIGGGTGRGTATGGLAQAEMDAPPPLD